MTLRPYKPERQLRKDEQVYNNLSQDRSKLDKYGHQGIYIISITIGGEKKILYIGKSQNMLKRLSAHIAHIRYPYMKESYSNKYNVLRDLIDMGITIQFDVIQPGVIDQDMDLSQREGYWIRHYMPVLNYQIPKENGKGYTINKKANTITIQEILNV